MHKEKDSWRLYLDYFISAIVVAQLQTAKMIATEQDSMELVYSGQFNKGEFVLELHVSLAINF